MPFVVSAPNQIAEAPVEWDEGAFNWLIASACAEEAETVVPDEKYALPVDETAGMALNAAAYTENGYRDDSITVEMETLEKDGVKWRIARVQIKHPSQLRTATAGGIKSSKTALPSSMAKAKNAIFIRADGHGVPELLDAILQVIPLDTYVDTPVMLMEKMECDKDLVIPVWDTYKEIVAKYDDRGQQAVGNIDRFDFYDEAKDCYCILQTGESAIYANVIIQKGVIK